MSVKLVNNAVEQQCRSVDTPVCISAFKYPPFKRLSIYRTTIKFEPFKLHIPFKSRTKHSLNSLVNIGKFFLSDIKDYVLCVFSVYKKTVFGIWNKKFFIFIICTWTRTRKTISQIIALKVHKIAFNFVIVFWLEILIL